MIPTIIADNFFPDPDKIVDFAMKQQFHSTKTGTWPGKRTDYLHELNKDLFDFVVTKILKLISLNNCKYWEFDMSFQLIEPYGESQYDSRNCGWVHEDYPSIFSGIIYLNKNPEKDTGTIIYSEKFGFSNITMEDMESKRKNFLKDKVSNSQFEMQYHKVNSQFEESIVVNNVYNRILMFSGNTYHSVKTYGLNQERLTLAFFCRSITLNTPPIVL
jgi:hypothetical protein